MTIQPSARLRTFRLPSSAAVSSAGAVVAALVFGGLGLVGAAAGAALPLSLGIVEAQNLAVPPAELALAQRLNGIWWAIAAVGVANIVAAFAVLDSGALGKRIGIVVAGTGMALAWAAEIAFIVQGEAAIVAVAIANLYLVALVGALLARRTA